MLETSQYPSGFCPEEVALFVGVDGKYPSSGHIILRLELLRINEIKTWLQTMIFTPGFFRFSKVLVAYSYFLGRRDFLLALPPAVLVHRCGIQRSRMSLV